MKQPTGGETNERRDGTSRSRAWAGGGEVDDGRQRATTTRATNAHDERKTSTDEAQPRRRRRPTHFSSMMSFDALPI
jgi:hypothetical protein